MRILGFIVCGCMVSIVMMLTACSGSEANSTSSPSKGEIKQALTIAMSGAGVQNNSASQVFSVDSANCKKVESAYYLCDLVYQAQYIKDEGAKQYNEKIVFERKGERWAVNNVKTAEYCEK